MQVGEIIKVEKDHFFPADLLLVSSTNDDGIAYVETMNLDGETNLKIKKALDQTKGLTETNLSDFKVRQFSVSCLPALPAPHAACFAVSCIHGPHVAQYAFCGRLAGVKGGACGMQGEIHCEQPNASLYTFTGNLILKRAHARSGTIALSPASILLRGSSLRNTKSILGLVIFAGHETKVTGAPTSQL